MNKNYIKLLTLIFITVITMSLISCGGGEKGNEQAKDERISFHDVSFVCPEGYVFDKETSDEDNLYYKIFDENGLLQKMIYFNYLQLDEPGNILEPDNAKPFCEAATSGDGMSDYSGYEIVSYNDELSGLEFSFNYTANDEIYHSTANAFCDDSGGVYYLTVATLNDESLDDLNAVINSMKYTFKVFDSSNEDKDEETEEQEKSDNKEDKDESEVSPEFKKMMDSYEAFFDEYVEFMKKYQNSSDSASMLTDYAEYMTKYADYMKKLEDLNEDEMTVAEAAYYTEVNARIMTKLAEIS